MLDLHSSCSTLSHATPNQYITTCEAPEHTTAAHACLYLSVYAPSTTPLLFFPLLASGPRSPKPTVPSQDCAQQQRRVQAERHNWNLVVSINEVTQSTDSLYPAGAAMQRHRSLR